MSLSRLFEELAAYNKAIADLGLNLHKMSHSESKQKFLSRLRNDPNKHFDRIWRNFAPTDVADNADHRAAFESMLCGLWLLSNESSRTLAAMRRLAREADKVHARICKQVAEVVVWKIPPLEKAALLRKAAEVIGKANPRPLAAVDKLAEGGGIHFRQMLHQLIDIRSDHSGSRPRTAFMRLAAFHFHTLTEQQHYDWVADLTDVAFHSHEATTVDSVRSACRSRRSARQSRARHSGRKKRRAI
jgi:hypothetical protein